MLHKSHATLERWLRLMQAWNFPDTTDTFDTLARAYAEPWRHYHTAEHISACLQHLDTAAPKLAAPHEVEIALWFHDAVYKPLAGDNERASADWAARFMAQAGAGQNTIARVYRLIMATRHDGAPITRDEAALVDIDLSILGAAPAIFQRYEQHIRKEYARVPWFIYRGKRASLLRGFLARRKIYSSGIFPDATEQQARSNLALALTALKKRG